MMNLQESLKVDPALIARSLQNDTPVEGDSSYTEQPAEEEPQSKEETEEAKNIEKKLSPR